MKLQDFVPPLELCKQIPDEEFGNSALVYCEYSFAKKSAIINGDVPLSILLTERWRENYFIEPPTVCNIYPAPTVEDIFADISETNYCPTVYLATGKWEAGCIDGKIETVKSGMIFSPECQSASEAALRLWFKVKGISVSDESRDKEVKE